MASPAAGRGAGTALAVPAAAGTARKRQRPGNARMSDMTILLDGMGLLGDASRLRRVGLCGRDAIRQPACDTDNDPRDASGQSYLRLPRSYLGMNGRKAAGAFRSPCR